MGLIKRGILGGFSGRVANVVGGSWKGKAYMRSLPLSVANPKTAGQVGQRTKFRTIQAIASIMLVAIVKPLWDRFAQGMSGYNAFIKSNISAVSSAGVVTWANIKTSVGSLTAASIANVISLDDSSDVAATWVDNSGTGSALGTDEAYLAVYNATKDEWGFSSDFTRADAGSSAAMPSVCNTDDVIHVYLSFRRPDGTLVSDSDYSTVVTG